MTDLQPWGPGWGPNNAPSALCLTFDNLGEAADIEMGSWPGDAAVGSHYTAVLTVPRLLEALGGLPATFFIEGWNAEIYPELLKSIVAAGHEVACHGWRHELWSRLDGHRQRACLERAIAAFRAIGIDVRGLRPPGGFLPEGVTSLAHGYGLDYVSAAGDAASRSEVAEIPFHWADLDGVYLDPAAARMVGLSLSGDTTLADFAAHLDRRIAAIIAEGSHAVLVMHPYIIEPTEGYWDLLQAFFDRLRSNDRLWVARCADLALALDQRAEGNAPHPCPR